MRDFKKSIILFVFIILMVLPPFFNGGNGALIGSAVLVFIGLAFLLFSGMDGADKKNENEKFFLSPFFFLFLFLVFSLITVFFSISPYNSFAVWFQYLSYGVLFFIAANLKIKKKEIDFLVKIFLAVSGVLCLIGIYFYLTGSYIRLTSTFYWPNPFAGYLLFSLPLALYWFLGAGKYLKEKLLPGLVLILLISSFILTGSRGAFLSILSVLPVFFYYFYKFPQPPFAKGGNNNEKSPNSDIRGGHNRAKGNFVDILSIIILSAILITGISFLKQGGFWFASHMEKSFTESDFSANIRLNYWRGAWEISKDYPVFGSGLGTFGTIYPRYQKDPVSAGKYAHNLYLEMMSEAGMFVLILFIIFLASIYFRGMGFNPPTPLLKGGIYEPPLQKGGEGGFLFFGGLDCQKYALPLFVGTWAFLIHNGVDIDWHFGAGTLVFWIFLGLLYNITKNKREDYSWRKFRWPIVFISALLAISGIILLYGGYYFSEGTRLQSRGELALAENAFSKSIFLNTNPKYLRQYGIILYARGAAASDGIKKELLKKAFKASQKAIALDGGNALNYELRGRIYYAQNKFIEAEADFRKAIELNKFNPRHYIDLSVLLIKQNKKNEARKIIEKILSYYPEKTVKNREARIMKNQEVFSRIKREIDYLKYLLSTL